MDTRKGWMYLLRYSFFGLVPESKILIHRSIFELAYFSEGAISVTEAYELPIYLRIYYLKCLEELKDRERKQIENQGKYKSGEVVKKP